MIVAPCFEGDEDMALAGVQHDLYFAQSGRLEITIGGMRTLGWIWNSVVLEAERRRQFIPWIDRHFERIRRIDRFSHKLLQLHHQHIAEIPLLLSSRDALLAFAKLMLYRNFDASDQAADALHDILMRRYGFECVADVWWAADVAARALPRCGPCGCPGSTGGAHV
jgi:hypothetical protein